MQILHALLSYRIRSVRRGKTAHQMEEILRNNARAVGLFTGCHQRREFIGWIVWFGAVRKLAFYFSGGLVMKPTWAFV
jgi:hypothetical protein